MAHLRRAAVALVASAGLILTACSSEEGSSADGTTSAASSSAESTDESAASESGETVTIEDNHGSQVVPLNAERVAATDNRSFEILKDWGIDLVAAPVGLIPFTVEADENTVDIGNHREPDLEALTAAEPDLIINGQRFQNFYEDIAALNPDAAIVELEPRTDDGEPLDEELKRHVTGLGEIFGKQAEAEQLVADFEEALERAQAAYNPEQTVMAVNVSGGEIGYLAPTVGRTYGPLFDLIGMTPALEVAEATDDHQGDDISVEAIAESNPDWLLVLDRDGGTSSRTEADYTPAQDVISENPALQNTAAISEDRVYYAPADTYTNENIITYTEILNEIADAFEASA